MWNLVSRINYHVFKKNSTLFSPSIPQFSNKLQILKRNQKNPCNVNGIFMTDLLFCQIFMHWKNLKLLNESRRLCVFCRLGLSIFDIQFLFCFFRTCEDGKVPMSYDERRALWIDFCGLSPPLHSKCLDMIKAYEPEFDRNLDGFAFSDLDVYNVKTLNALRAFIDLSKSRYTIMFTIRITILFFFQAYQ